MVDSYKIKKEKTVKDFINDMRRFNRNYLNENEEGINKKTIMDQKEEEEKFLRFINRKDVVVDFINLEIKTNGVIWGGTIDDVFKFFYRVTPDKKTSTFNFKFLDGFDPLGEETDPDDEYVEKQMDLFKSVKDYYERFSNWVRTNIPNFGKK